MPLWWNGRHGRLKICCFWRAGSSPVRGTKFYRYFLELNMLNLKVLILICLSLLSGCKKAHNDSEDVILPALEIYDQGKSLIAKGQYKKAAEKFADLYYQHPGSEITAYAELMEAYCYYLNNKYEDSVDILDAFLKLHPAHPDVYYAYYLKALSLFMQMSDVYFDQSSTHQAIDALNQVIEKFPDTQYALDCKDKLIIAKDYSAAQNMEIGRYYLFAKNNPIAAVKRFQDVIQTDSAQVPEALYRIHECFMLMGLADEAGYYLKKLGREFPENYWALKASKH